MLEAGPKTIRVRLVSKSTSRMCLLLRGSDKRSKLLDVQHQGCMTSLRKKSGQEEQGHRDRGKALWPFTSF